MKYFFNYDLIVYTIYLAVNYQIPIFIPFRQTGGNKIPNNT